MRILKFELNEGFRSFLVDFFCYLGFIMYILNLFNRGDFRNVSCENKLSFNN